MCRPLWACWVNGHAYTVRGEGSHEKLIAPALLEVIMAGDGPLPTTFRGNHHPFECRWPTERVARFQPQGDRFYAFEDLPTRRQFDMAQAALDADMGDWEKLRDWVLAAAKLYGINEFEGNRAMRVGGTLTLTLAQLSALTSGMASIEPLYSACCSILTGDKAFREAGLERRKSGEEAFQLWAEAFSERSNRVPLWAN